jgi:hypothetical protein
MKKQQKFKRCIDCKKELPITEFYERPNYNRTITIYYQSMCKKCEIIRAEKWRINNLKRYRIYQNNWHKKYFKNHD